MNLFYKRDYLEQIKCEIKKTGNTENFADFILMYNEHQTLFDTAFTLDMYHWCIECKNIEFIKFMYNLCMEKNIDISEKIYTFNVDIIVILKS